MFLSTFARLMLFLGSAFAFIYGITQYFKRRKALFNQIVVCAMGCIMLGRLFTLLCLLLGNELGDGFSISVLGSFGGFLFLFSAGYGQMDGLVDGRQPEFRPYRLAAFAAPLVILGHAVAAAASDNPAGVKITAIVMMIPMMLSSYYNLKQFIIPDVEFGILESIRKYNFVALALCILSTLEIYFELSGMGTALAILELIISGLYFAIIPVLKGGSSKWTI